MIDKFLAGICVLDLSQFTPGPYATLLLADLGADVIKVEPPNGDPQRIEKPLDRDGISAAYKVINRSKSVVKLDLKSLEGRNAFTALLGRADLLLESFRPGVMDRLGFTRDRLEAINSQLIHCALSGWGQTGPYRLKPGHDLNYMAFGGGLLASGTPETPVMTTPTIADYSGGLFAATMMLSALAARPARGRGAFLDVSLAETPLSWLSLGLTESLRPDYKPCRAANPFNGGLACYQIYRTADDRFVTLGVVEEKFWCDFCEAVARLDWIARQWEPVPQHALIAEIAALFRSRTRDEWDALLADRETCYHAVLDFDELAEHPQIRARQVLALETGPDPMAEILLPVWLDGSPPPKRRALREVDAAEALRVWQTRDSPDRR
jgi:alpha-methylacyl-CoA racemase